MGDWPVVRLGDVVDLVSGFPFSSSRYTADPDDLRLVRGDNVVQGGLRWDGVKRWQKAETKGLDAYWLQHEDVVLAMDRPWIAAGLKYAAITTADVPSLLVQRVSRLRGTERLLTSFLKYVIGSQAFTDYVLAIQTGTAVPHISGGQIRAYEFALPSLAEQQDIADVLGALDAKVTANLATARLAEDFARALLASHAAAAPRVPLSTLAITVRDVQDPGVMGEQLIDHYSIPALDAGGAETVEAQSVKSVKSALPKSCVLVSRLNPSIPRAWYVTQDGERPALASTEFAVLAPRDSLGSEAVYSACSQSEFFRDLASKVTGTSTSHQRVRVEDVLATPVLDPRAIGDIDRAAIKQTVRLADHLRGEVRHLRATRAALLPELITGRLVVQARAGEDLA